MPYDPARHRASGQDSATGLALWVVALAAFATLGECLPEQRALGQAGMARAAPAAGRDRGADLLPSRLVGRAAAWDAPVQGCRRTPSRKTFET